MVSHQVNQLPFRLENSSNPKRSATAWAILKKRTVWAIHEKQKFDGFIQDLSFLIDSLEKVVGRTIMPPLEKNPELVMPPQTPEANPKALGVTPCHNPITKGKQVPPYQPIQLSTNPPTHVQGIVERLRIDEVVQNLDGAVYNGSQHTKGGTIVMGNVGKSDKRRNMYNGNQKATYGLAVMGNVSVEALSSLQEANGQRMNRGTTVNESDESESESRSDSEGK